MKTILRGAVLVGLLIATIAPASSAVPKMAMSEDHFNFGTAPQSSSVSHVFWLKSVGDEPLKILQVVPGCGCTKAPLEKSEIAVGDSTRLEIIFNTGHYRNRIVKKPRIVTNEDSPEYNITFEANVLAPGDSSFPLKIIPSILEISAVEANSSTRTHFAIRNVSNEDVQVTMIAQPQNLFDIELPQTIKAGQGVKGIIALRPDGTGNSFKSSFTVAVNGADTTRFTIPVVYTASKESGK